MGMIWLIFLVLAISHARYGEAEATARWCFRTA
jgi:hypothetical protein